MKKRESEIKLNLGCGHDHHFGYMNIDCREECKPDRVFNIEDGGLGFLKDNSVDEVRAFDFLEHIALGRTVFVIEEIYRVLRPAGYFEHFTPSTDGRGAFQDPTHKSFWNINSWLYYTSTARELYGIKALFGIIKLEDRETNEQLSEMLFFGPVIHTYGLMYAMKGAESE